MPAAARAGPVHRQQPGTPGGSPMEMARAPVLDPPSTASQGSHEPIAGLEAAAYVDLRHSEMGYRCSKQRLDSLHHGSCHVL